MTNIEYYGCKNLEYFQTDGRDHSAIDIYYIAKHAPENVYFKVGDIWCRKEDVVKEKTKWLLAEPKHDNYSGPWTVVWTDGWPRCYKMRHGIGGN